MSDPVRVGLIGFGAWGTHHAAAIAATDGAELVAIAGHSDASCQRARQAHSAAAIYDAYEKMLATETLDVVVVVLPSHLHYQVGKAVLESGRHMLLEKPMCLNLADCTDLIELANRKGRILAVGHELRHSSLWGKAKELIDSGVIGTPQYVLVELSRKPYRLGAAGWRYDINRVGNWILEEPIHFFDFARWYLQSAGNPVSVYATANSRQVDHPELQDNFSAILRFPQGAYAVISQTLSAFEHHQTVKISGSKGALWASWSGAMDRTPHPTFSLRVFDGEEVQNVPIEKITGEIFELEDQVAMMVSAVRSSGPIMADGNDGRWSVAMCLAAQESVDSGQPVSIADLR